MSLQNIKNNSIRSIYCRLLNDKYYDFMLYRGETKGAFNPDDCAIADFSTFDIDENGRLYSTKTWDQAVNEGVEMEDIGFTGPDNGFILFLRDRISNQEFLDMFTGSTYSIESGDTRMFFTPVSGNTQIFKYPMEFVDEDEKYIAFKGGFYQGFFKLFGFKYQTLPTDFGGEGLTFEFDIRPRTDYVEDQNSVNALHPENKGIFFYIGTRAENKFWSLYGGDDAIMDSLKTKNAYNEGYFTCGDETYEVGRNDIALVGSYLLEPDNETTTIPPYFIDNYTISSATKDCPCISDAMEWCDYFLDDDQYMADEGYLMPASRYIENYCTVADYTGKCGCEKTKMDCHGQIPQGEFLTVFDLYSYKYESDSHCGCSPCRPDKDCGECCECKECDTCEDYFQDGYYIEHCADQGPIESAYFGLETPIRQETIMDSFGHMLMKKGYYQILSDNKFLMFDRTKEGFTVRNWVEGTSVLLTGRTDNGNPNYFLLMNRTCTGYTASNIELYNEAHTADYNIYRDIRDNAFALKVNEDGSIGYRYGSLNCESEEQGYELLEERSKPGMIRMDEWNKVVVRFVPLEPSGRKGCNVNNGRMRLMIYVNGNLVFISKELRGFRFRELNDVYQKQEGVPYSMSIGGGTQGLLESILPDYYNSIDYTLPLERDFCGTFIGDMKLFKIYNCFLDYSTIIHYLR